MPFLQVGWTIRAILMPSYAAIGSASSFAKASGADEVVLNALAMSFVFDLDEMFYAIYVPRLPRARYENAYDQETPAVVKSGLCPLIISVFSWLTLASE